MLSPEKIRNQETGPPDTTCCRIGTRKEIEFIILNAYNSLAKHRRRKRDVL